MRGTPILFFALVIQACGAGEGELPSGSGGAPGAGGSLQSGGAGGGQAETGGTPGAGGASDGAGGSGDGVGGSGANESCPSIPLSRLLPITGPFFLGPDPGPCGQTSSDGLRTGTFAYEGDLVVSSTLYGGEIYTRDAEGRMLSYEVQGSLSTFEYEEQAYYEHFSDQTTRYELDEKGYPLRVLQAYGTAEEALWHYEYKDCRLVRRIAPPGSEDLAREYSYDAEGHIAAYVEGAITVSFDYSCWD